MSSLLVEINRQKLKLYDQEFNKLTNKYTQLLNASSNLQKEIDELKKENDELKKENDELKKENKKNNSMIENIFYTTNENGYNYELEQINLNKT
jgi:peptidoglycan hydrolase CwlO-like protein